MKRTNMLRAVLGGAAFLLGLAEARADYQVSASTAAANAQLTVCGFTVSNVISPCHVIVDSAKAEMFKAANPGMVGLVFGGSALTLGQKASAASLPTVLSAEQEAILTALRSANGTTTDAAYNGSNNPSQIALLKALYGQAAPTSAPGTSIGSGVPVPGFQGVAGGVPLGANILLGGVAPSVSAPIPVTNSVGGAAVSGSNPFPVDTVVRVTATPRSAILPVQAASASPAAGGATNAVNDVLTAVGGTCSIQPKFNVTAVSSGAATALTVNTAGSCTVLPASPVATTSSGSGTGTTVNATYAGLAIQIAPANTVRRGLHIQPQGGVGYLRGAGATATPDYNSLKVAADALYETSPAFVGTGALSMITGGTTPLGVYIAEF